MDHSSVMPYLPYHLLEEMTNGFSEDRKLGSGSYGEVYLGLHKNGEKIAVKMLRWPMYDPKQGLNDAQFQEYRNLENLRHQNVVRLVGYCYETHRERRPYEGELVFAEVTHRALCLEYMQNGSLDRCLSDESTGDNWHTRYSIIKGVCKGLQYLHEELKPPIFHLDLKPANVLLDENNVPKIADFGISRLIREEGTCFTNSHIGTLGYIPPESINQGAISNKWDVFSLGVIILQIIAGPKGYSRSADVDPKEKFIELVHGNWKNRLQAASVDALESYCEQVKICTEIALRCVEANRHKRPTIGDIVNELNKTETINPFLDGLRNDPGSSMDQRTRQSYITEVEEKPAREKLSEPENLFGEVIDDDKLDQMVRYVGKPKSQEDRAREAWNLMKEDDKDGKASRYVRDIVPYFPVDKSSFYFGKTGTLCLLYNATGNTLSYVANHDWEGHIGSAPFPKEIGNGQWAAFHHAMSPFGWTVAMGSMGAVVYRGKNTHGYYRDYLLAWCRSDAMLERNKSYCEIGGIDYYQTRWDRVKKELAISDYSSNDKSNDGCEIEVKIGKGRRFPEFTAIISCQSYITEVEEKPARVKLSEPENLFGEVIDDYKLDQMATYVGKPKSQEDRAREAWNLMKEDDKDGKASRYVHDMVAFSFITKGGTLCLLYNATGNTLSYVANHDWHGHIGSAPFPKEIGNGQWAAFHHAMSFGWTVGMGSMGAVVYRGKKNTHGYYRDYLLAWYRSVGMLDRNKSYCEIGGIDYYQTRWDRVKKELAISDYSSNDKSTDGCEIEVKIGKGLAPEFTAIISCR